MFKQLTLVAGLAITATLVGCASDAYYAAKSACEPLAYNKFPPKMVSQLVTKTRTVDVPIGMTNCSSKVSGSSINTTCRFACNHQNETPNRIHFAFNAAGFEPVFVWNNATGRLAKNHRV